MSARIDEEVVGMARLLANGTGGERLGALRASRQRMIAAQDRARRRVSVLHRAGTDSALTVVVTDDGVASSEPGPDLAGAVR